MAHTPDFRTYKHSLVRVSFQFRNIDDNPADPTLITLKLRTPAQAETTYSYPGPDIVRVSLGAYYFQFLASEEGLYQINVVGTGALQAGSKDYTVLVRDSEF
jgi:hypothetical protein